MFGRFLFDKNSTCMIVSNQKININMMRLLDYARSDHVLQSFRPKCNVAEKSNPIKSSHLDQRGEV